MGPGRSRTEIGQHLDRNRAIQRDIVGKVDDAHRTTTKLTLEGVSPGEGGLKRKRGIVGRDQIRHVVAPPKQDDFNLAPRRARVYPPRALRGVVERALVAHPPTRRRRSPTLRGSVCVQNQAVVKRLRSQPPVGADVTGRDHAIAPAGEYRPLIPQRRSRDRLDSRLTGNSSRASEPQRR